MRAARFLDTNILLYAYDLDAGIKRERALEIVEQGWKQLGQTAVSVQVLQELHVNMERRGIPRLEIHQLVRDYTLWPVVDNTLSLLQGGIAEQSRWQLSLWDSMILAAARSSGASQLITEDFSHGQNYGGIKAINPFL